MAGILEGVDQRTKLAGHNRFELLLFRLLSRQRFGINVFKVQEVIQCPPLTKMPNLHTVICGVAHLRGRTIPILDLSLAIGLETLSTDSTRYVIVTEYNRTVQGFLVGSVDRIINISWSEVKGPPAGIGLETYLTAVTEVDNELIEVIDVEKIMKDVIGGQAEASAAIVEPDIALMAGRVLAVDDSTVARTQIKHVCEQLGIECILLKDGEEAWQHLSELTRQSHNIANYYAMIISDVEMPRMDGYTLASKIKQQPAMKDVHLMLHSSLSGVFNIDMAKKVGANEFLAKFDPDLLAKSLQKQMRSFHKKELLETA